MAIQLTGQFIYQFSDETGAPLVGGSVGFYEAGSTSILQPIYADSGETQELDNPITLDSLGSFGTTLVFLNGNYNIVIRDADGIIKWTRDNFNATVSSSAVLDWRLNAQQAGSFLGEWTTVKNTVGVTINAQDIVLGDNDHNGYELRTGGDSNVDPETDTYDPNTGIGVEWVNLAIRNAPITQQNLDLLQDQIDNLESQVNFQGYISGLITSNNTLDSDHDIDFGTGTAQDSSNQYRINATSLFTKAIDSNWAEGTSQGGIASGLAPVSPNEWYRCFLIGKSTDSVAFDFGFDTSETAINLLNDASADDYDIYRQVGWVITDGSGNILGYKQDGDRFTFDDRSIDRAYAVGANNTDELVTVQCPIGTTGLFSGLINTNTNLTFTTYLQFHRSDQVPSSVQEETADLVCRRDENDYISNSAGNFEVYVDSSNQIGVFCTDNNVLWGMSTIGFDYPRGVNG